MRLNYRQKIFLYFFLVFALFTTGIVLFEQSREKKYKTEIFESVQKEYIDVIRQYMLVHKIQADSIVRLREVLPLLPPGIRVTIMANDGRVIFDNDVNNAGSLENHKDRPEILAALLKDYGSNIRNSSSLNREFLYLAKHYDDGYFIRVASPYNIEVKNFFKSDNVFLYFIIFLFFAVLIAIIYLSNRFGQSIARLKDFVASAQSGESDLQEIHFPDDELGDIGYKIVELYKQIRENKKKIAVEREKLLQHFHSSQEGICFFTSKRKKIYSNSHFIQYLNILTDQPTLSVNTVFEDPIFSDLQHFLNRENTSEMPFFDTGLSKNGKHFNLKAIRFDDGSFEVTIDDVTKTEKTRFLKQEMTNNIAHELRTPVTSIRGYLETLHGQPDIDDEKRRFFIDRSFVQIVRLSELIRDISIITRIEEAPVSFEVETVNIHHLLVELKTDLSAELTESNITFEFNVNEAVRVEGNRMLLFSIFRNLLDNSISYGGEGIEVQIDNYLEDDEYYYFSYYDTGSGVDEHHLTRLFERFYRVNEGRTRDTGGSGLGLSIVRNAVLFHKGEITAKLRQKGGLEFLFTLRKKH